MAIIKNVALYHPKLDPKRPNASFNKNNPTWELQIRTSDPAQKAEWEAINLKPKLMVYKEGAKDAAGEDVAGMPILDVNGKKQWRVNLKKKSLKKDGEKSDPVDVVAHDLKPVDPNTIGNGSIAHIRLYQYEYVNDKPGAASKTGVASVIMGIQLKKHIVYTPKPFEGFDMEDGETVIPDDDDEDGHGTNDSGPSVGSPASPASPSTPRAPVDTKPEEAF